MKIEHLAIWTEDLDRLKSFYIKFFKAKAGEKYTNRIKKFESYFLEFETGSRLEIMRIPGLLLQDKKNNAPFVGLAHFAMSVGSIQEVNALTEELRKNNFTVIGEPRTTGDGYYESVVLDPDGNQIEITV